MDTPLPFIKVGTRMVACALFYLLVGCTSLLQDHRTPSATRQSNVQRVVDSVRTALQNDLQNQVPSLNVLIQTPDEKIFVSSVPAGGIPVTETANFRFASNTKTFTAAAILTMYQAGWLDFRAHITGLIPGTTVPYVPDTPDWDFPYKKDITIEQLVKHTAGVYDIDNKAVPGFNGKPYTEAIQLADPTHQFTTEEMIHQLILNPRLGFPPDSTYEYSNTGYAILGKIIERVYSTKSGSAKTYNDYLQDYVVGPNTLVPVSVHFPVKATDTVLPAPRVEGLELTPGKATYYGDYNMSAQVAEGNGYGTMAALNTFIRSLMKGQNVLTPQTVQLMQTDIVPGKPTHALGITLTPNLGYGHNGARIGNLALMAYDPATDVSVVVYLPFWDLTKEPDSFNKCIGAIYEAGWAARAVLGYPGKP